MSARTAMGIDGKGHVDRVVAEICILALRRLVGDGQWIQRDTDLQTGYVWTLSVCNVAEWESNRQISIQKAVDHRHGI